MRSRTLSAISRSTGSMPRMPPGSMRSSPRSSGATARACGGQRWARWPRGLGNRSMLESRLNPRGVDAAYLSGLHGSHPGWGDEAAFAWWYRRSVDAPAADLVTIFDGDQLVAGMSVSWRAATGGGVPRLVGIMGGAWTLPSHRRRGCF